MKTEKILAGILALLIVLCCVVYFTLPEQGEQIYIPYTESIPEGVEIPDGYKPVENFTDVYYVETEDGKRYYWLVEFSDGSYGWQEVDKDGTIIFPNREPQQAETTEPTTEPAAEPTEEATEVSEENKTVE